MLDFLFEVSFTDPFTDPLVLMECLASEEFLLMSAPVFSKFSSEWTALHPKMNLASLPTVWRLHVSAGHRSTGWIHLTSQSSAGIRTVWLVQAQSTAGTWLCDRSWNCRISFGISFTDALCQTPAGVDTLLNRVSNNPWHLQTASCRWKKRKGKSKLKMWLPLLMKNTHVMKLKMETVRLLIPAAAPLLSRSNSLWKDLWRLWKHPMASCPMRAKPLGTTFRRSSISAAKPLSRMTGLSRRFHVVEVWARCTKKQVVLTSATCADFVSKRLPKKTPWMGDYKWRKSRSVSPAQRCIWWVCAHLVKSSLLTVCDWLSRSFESLSFWRCICGLCEPLLKSWLNLLHMHHVWNVISVQLQVSFSVCILSLHFNVKCTLFRGMHLFEMSLQFNCRSLSRCAFYPFTLMSKARCFGA